MSEALALALPERRYRARPGAVGLVCCLGIALLGGCRQEEAKYQPLPVKVQQVKLITFTPAASLSGEIAARQQSDLAFRLSGRIVERTVDVGAHVAAGEVLARLDPKVQEADVEGAAAAVQAAETRLQQVASVFGRQKTLLADGFTTRRDYDRAEQEQRSAQAMLDSATAQLATARDQLAQTVLSAPAPGIITARHMEIGQVAQPSMPVFALAQDGPRDAVINVQESVLAGGFKNNIEISLVSGSGGKAHGEVREISPVINGTGAVRVKIGLTQTPPEMALGSAVKVTGYAKPQDRVVLPWSALYADGDIPSVWVVDPQNGTVSLRRIQIEAYKNSDIIIRDGLRPGETVVTAGTHLLRPEQQIAIAEKQQ